MQILLYLSFIYFVSLVAFFVVVLIDAQHHIDRTRNDHNPNSMKCYFNDDNDNGAHSTQTHSHSNLFVMHISLIESFYRRKSLLNTNFLKWKFFVALQLTFNRILYLYISKEGNMQTIFVSFFRWFFHRLNITIIIIW